MKGQYFCRVGDYEERLYETSSPENAAKQHALWWYTMIDSKGSFDVHVRHSNAFRHFRWAFAMPVRIVFEPFEISRLVTDHHGNTIHKRSEPRPRARAA
jgi:hypothetical protein